MISTPDRDPVESRLGSLLDLARAASGVPGVGAEVDSGPGPTYVGPPELWERDEAVLWDRAGRRRGRLVAYDVPDRSTEPLDPADHEMLARAAAAVGDLLSVEELLETEQELSSAVSMTHSAVARREQREARVQVHVDAQLRDRVGRVLRSLEDGRSTTRSARTELSGAAARSEALARAEAEVRALDRFLDEVSVVRGGPGEPVTAVHRIEDLLDDALAAIDDLTPVGQSRESFADVRVVSTGDTRVVVDGPGVARAIGHLLVHALASGREHERADRVEVDVTVRGDVAVISIEDDGAPQRGRAVRALLAAGPGGTDGPGAGVELAYVRAVAEAHGGRVWVEDGDLGGSAVRLTLPAAPVGEMDRRREEPGSREDTGVPSGRGGAVRLPGRDDDDEASAHLDHEAGEEPDTEPGTEPGADPDDDAVPDNVRGIFDRR